MKARPITFSGRRAYCSDMVPCGGLERRLTFSSLISSLSVKLQPATIRLFYGRRLAMVAVLFAKNAAV